MNADENFTQPECVLMYQPTDSSLQNTTVNRQFNTLCTYADLS